MSYFIYFFENFRSTKIHFYPYIRIFSTKKIYRKILHLVFIMINNYFEKKWFKIRSKLHKNSPPHVYLLFTPHKKFSLGKHKIIVLASQMNIFTNLPSLALRMHMLEKIIQSASFFSSLHSSKISEYGHVQKSFVTLWRKFV